MTGLVKPSTIRCAIAFVRPVWLFLLLSPVFFSAVIVEAADSHAAIEAYHRGDFDRAADEFAKAEKRSPEDLRLVYNHGIALAAAGRRDEAVAELRKSAPAKDRTIASGSLRLLGTLAVQQARELLAEAPEETPTEQRREIFECLEKAESYYLEALTLEDDGFSRSGLEQIRAWKTRMRRLWNEFDRSQKRRGEFNDRLHWLEDWENELTGSVRSFDPDSASPKTYQSLYEKAREQGHLAEEIERIQSDLLGTIAEFQAPTEQESETEQRRQEAAQLSEELGRLAELARGAEQSLHQFDSQQALRQSEELSSRLQRLRMILAPFEEIVREAEALQSRLCNISPGKPGDSSDSGEAPTNPPPDFNRQSSDQRKIADWMPLVLWRARQGLQAFEQQAEPKSTDSESTEPTVTPSDVSADPTEALRQSMETAVRQAPEIHRHAESAADALRDSRPADAWPDQQRALELLREILEPLRQQDQDSNQQQDPQQDQQQQGRDDNRSERSGEDREQPSGKGDQDRQNGNPPQNEKNEKKENRNEPQEPKPPEGNDGDDSRQEPEKKSNPEKTSEPETPEEKGDGEKLSPQQQREVEKAERMLRQAKRRQQENDQRRRYIRDLLLQLEPVEKDW